MSDVDRMTTLASGWALALAVLAFAWARTPLVGSGPAFLAWSVPALVLAALSWSWLRRAELPALRLTASQAAGGVVVWAALLAVTLGGVGAEWALDGLILRNTPQRLAGLGLRWLPGLFAALVSVAGLAAALEARYRITHPVVVPADPASPVSPPGP